MQRSFVSWLLKLLIEGDEEQNKKEEEKEVQREAYAACDRLTSQATSNGLSGQAWLTPGLAIYFCDDPWKEIRETLAFAFALAYWATIPYTVFQDNERSEKFYSCFSVSLYV
jgi:hypothetical protein